ncbi:hypothetical protein KHA96_11215 [Bacillus sp. FJAT-49711]|uniref:hypothetical protein n=1 Tax=Bacillus sp. FJAT-49711 TaxID=2833585 RepID=UPI001BC9AAC2|nr:hypothetical protein [Bacillus sp. FJAT-49711]MBS4218883.1 hypothetical protein [Bacillus sp. FJAT-49711]
MIVWMMSSSTPFWKVISAFANLIVQRLEEWAEAIGRLPSGSGCKATGTIVIGFCGIRKASPSVDTLIILRGAT